MATLSLHDTVVAHFIAALRAREDIPERVTSVISSLVADGSQPSRDVIRERVIDANKPQ